MKTRYCLPALAALLLCLPVAPAPQRGSEKIIEALEKSDCTFSESPKVKICKYDYTADGRAVEAISFRPEGSGPLPALLLIPGHNRTARDYIPAGLRFAGGSYACLAVSQPGYGKSQGPPDFVGPKTIRALSAGFKKFQREPFVDARRLGVFGYSRGAMAASLLAVQLDEVRAAVFGAGVYDFKRAYDEIQIEGIRKNMEAETGMTAEAIRQRSSVFQMEQLNCPVLILHGGKDINVPVSQALLLRDRLSALGKEFEIKIFPDREHSLGPEVHTLALDFFDRKLKGGAPKGDR